MKYNYYPILTVFLILLVGCENSESEISLLDTEKLISNYESTLAWLDENATCSNRGYIIIDNPVSHYEITLTTDIIPEGVYSNIPDDVFSHSPEQFRSMKFVLVGNNCIYISDNTDFSNAQKILVGDFVIDCDKWFLTSVDIDTIIFNYGWLYVNAWLAESLIDMYIVTHNISYLFLARDYLSAATNHISNDGRWLRFTAVDTIPKYIAMSQAILMRALHKYIDVEEDASLSSALHLLSTTFQHGTEGVYNHWSNSRIGEMIRDDVLGCEQTNYIVLQEELSLLYSRIYSFNGKIPYIMDETNVNYPDFRETYQTYDTYLLALMSKYASEDIVFDEYFHICFNESIDVNYLPYFTNNIQAVLNIYQAYGIMYDDFMISQSNSTIIYSIPLNVRDAVSKLQSISALMVYDEEK